MEGLILSVNTLYRLFCFFKLFLMVGKGLLSICADLSTPASHLILMQKLFRFSCEAIKIFKFQIARSCRLLPVLVYREDSETLIS